MWQDLRVQPNFGQKEMHVTWTLHRGVTGEVFIYRSLTGSGGWELLNENSPVPAQMGAFTDTTYRPKSYNETPHYRALLRESNGTLTPSQPVGVLEDLTRMEKAGIALMIQDEYRAMRLTGVPVLLYFPLYSGTPCPSLDPHSGQSATFDCPDVDPAKDCFGQPFVGGFQSPVQTRMILQNIGNIIISHDGTRKVSGPVKRTVRLLPFPRPRADCMIVQPRTDERYLIEDAVAPHAFKGVYPIAFTASVTLLPKSDPRYRVRVPQLAIEP